MLASIVIRFVLLGLLFSGVLIFLLWRSTVQQFKRGLRGSAGERAAAKLMRTGQDPQAFIAKIPELADRHVAVMAKSFGEKLGYQKSDFPLLDAVIQKAWGEKLPKNLEPIIMSFGAYFGETVRRLRGGRWDYDAERGFCLQEVGGQATVYPFDKVRKRLQNGGNDSLALFYTALARMLDGKHKA